MQVTFNTDSSAEVTAVLAMLAAMGKSGATPAPAPAPAPAAKISRPLPPNAPEGSEWVPLPGAPGLRGPNGETLTVDWTRDPPMVVSAPPRTPDGNSLSGDDFKKILDGTAGR